MMMAGHLVVMGAAYLAGSVNFSILLFRILRWGDPRSRFSGNPGAFNVYRQAGTAWAALVLLLDMGRAFGVAWGATLAVPRELVPWAGFFLVLGTMFPLFHGFRGGKGVASFLGYTAFTAPLFVVLSAAVWITIYKLIVRVTFIASYGMVAVLAAGAILANHAGANNSGALPVAGTLSTAALIMAAHRTNVLEYLRGGKTGTRSG